MANATGVSITLATPPALSLPTGGASGIDLGTQAFSWSPMNPAGLYVVSMNTGMSRQFTCITASTSFTLPSTQELGLGTIPSNTSMSWRVAGYGGGVTTTDALTGATGPIGQALLPPGADSWL